MPSFEADSTNSCPDLAKIPWERVAGTSSARRLFQFGRVGCVRIARFSGVAGIVAPTLEDPSSEKNAEFFSISNEKSSGSDSSPALVFSFIFRRSF